MSYPMDRACGRRRRRRRHRLFMKAAASHLSPQCNAVTLLDELL
jgi:hypothetical protein